MTKVSLHLGINEYNTSIYGNANLNGCVNDATDMAALSSSLGYLTKVILNYEATKTRLQAEILLLSKTLKSGDTLLVSYSGHGTTTNLYGKPISGICLNDGVLWDYELKALFGKVKAQIIWISDSCHAEGNNNLLTSNVRFWAFDDIIRAKRPVFPVSASTKSVVSFYACKITQYSYDTSFNNRPCGFFTHCFLQVFKAQDFAKNIFLNTQLKMAEYKMYDQTPMFDVSRKALINTIF